MEKNEQQQGQEKLNENREQGGERTIKKYLEKEIIHGIIVCFPSGEVHPMCHVRVRCPIGKQYLRY